MTLPPRELGRTGLPVSALGFGAGPLDSAVHARLTDAWKMHGSSWPGIV